MPIELDKKPTKERTYGTNAITGKQEPWRDGNDQYRFLNPDKGELRSYTRASSIADGIEDKFMLQQWKLRAAIRGVGLRKSLYMMAKGHDPDVDRGVYDHPKEGLVAKALNEAKTDEAAILGKSLHRDTERYDLGTTDLEAYDEDVRPHITNYAAKLAESGFAVVPEHIEQVIINDDYGIGGQNDRVLIATRDILAEMPCGDTILIPIGTMIIGDLKGLPVTTPIATPEGWTTMGDLAVGDTVFDRKGTPTKVTEKSAVHNKRCYRLTFDDGTEMVADHDHRWWVGATRWQSEKVLTTEEISDQLFDSSTGQRHLHIKIAEPVDCPDADLPIEPYLLGAWLGDGHNRGGEITKPDPLLWAEIERRGHLLGKVWKQGDGTRTVRGLRTAIIANSLQHNKHIPAVYFRASTTQRRDLLAGLMDTDGSFNSARRECVYYSTDKALAEDVEELLLTLGYRTSLQSYQANGFGITTTAYAVKFRPHDQEPFISKAGRWNGVVKTKSQSWRRLIVSCEEVPSVPTQCISVDSPDSSYLCGRQMLPTHNTGKIPEYKFIEFGVQITIYANHTATWHVDHDHPQGGTRGERIDVSREVGLVIHLPATDPEGPCTLHWVDLRKGYEYFLLAMELRAMKSAPVKRQLIGEYVPGEPIEITMEMIEADAERQAIGPPPIETEAEVIEAPFGNDDLNIETLEWIMGRVAKIGECSAAAMGELQRRWPLRDPDGNFEPLPEVPTEDQIEAVLTVLDDVEARHEIPLPLPRPKAKQEPSELAKLLQLTN